jgi:hypothetical protein
VTLPERSGALEKKFPFWYDGLVIRKTPMGMRVKFRVILDQAISEGVKIGYRRAFKHNENPTEETIIETIEDCVMSSLYEYFDFPEEQQ